MTESFRIDHLAKTVAEAFPGPVEVEYLDNPRVEQEEHYYHVVHSGLPDLGLKPHLLSNTLIESLFPIVAAHRDRVGLEALLPAVQWRGALRQSAEASLTAA
jgi:UDP-sulfoquinovose synthase